MEVIRVTKMSEFDPRIKSIIVTVQDTDGTRYCGRLDVTE